MPSRNAELHSDLNATGRHSESCTFTLPSYFHSVGLTSHWICRSSLTFDSELAKMLTCPELYQLAWRLCSRLCKLLIAGGLGNPLHLTYFLMDFLACQNRLTSATTRTIVATYLPLATWIQSLTLCAYQQTWTHTCVFLDASILMHTTC